MNHPYAHPHLRNKDKNAYYSYKIGVSGAAQIDFLDHSVIEAGKELGRELARQGAVTINGATTGFPYWVAMGAKENRGICIGYSPAASEDEHVNTYRLPLDYMDLIVFTGFGFAGRDLLFTRSCDAIVIGPGRVGTIHEFTIAFEDKKPIGILHNDEWETDSILKLILEKSHRQDEGGIIIFEKDPKVLVQKLIDAIETTRKQKYVYKNDDNMTAKGANVLS